MAEIVRQLFAARFLRFVMIGGLSFLVDAGLLVLMMKLGAGPFAARVVSIAVAMLVAWRLNRALTFGSSHDGQLREAGRYALVAGSVAALNYALYAGLLLAVPACPPVLATAMSTLLCTGASFLGYGKFAFRTG
ncbi:GtrA family protein [Henriciella aquimarina]|uniref:GtrA family protein n=1 Tax=Henriciella aquimarina TaxID=545261 RepID=UPI0009FE35D4|nr:GtrA family protein [Henriciella aquimarina]